MVYAITSPCHTHLPPFAAPLRLHAHSHLALDRIHRGTRLELGHRIFLACSRSSIETQ